MANETKHYEAAEKRRITGDRNSEAWGEIPETPEIDIGV